MTTLIDYLKHHAHTKPRAPFLYENEKEWSFGSFYEEVTKLTTFLLQLGIQDGDYVLIHLNQKSQHLILYMALINIGAISVHLYPERENAYVIFAAQHTQAKAIISNTFNETLDNTLVLSFPYYDDLEPTLTTRINEIAYVMFTSGTTSSPKAVLTTHVNIMFVTSTLIELAGMQEGLEKEIIILPLGSTGGLGHFHASLLLGNSIRLFPGFYTQIQQALETLLDCIENEQITGMLLTPKLITLLLQNHKELLKQKCASLKYALANVTPMRKEVIEQFLTVLPAIRFCTYYGSTEASRSIVNVCRESGKSMHLTGKPPKDVHIKIHQPNKQGEGEIYIKGKNVMKGYLHLGKDSLDDGWFQSGDIGKMDEDGFFTILGRIKETISLDGLKLFPSELETILANQKNINDIGVCSIIDETSFTQIGLAVVLEDKNIDKKEFAQKILSLLRHTFKADQTKLYSYKIPHKIYFVDHIPRTDLGKIKRDALSQLLQHSTNTVSLKG